MTIKSVIGIGNALTDMLVNLKTDSVLGRFKLAKGSMSLVDTYLQTEISKSVAGLPYSLSLGGSAGNTLVRSVMDDAPLTCTMETDMDEVRRMMLDRHARYMPVIDKKLLMGVISFYDVAKAVVDSQNFENQMLKAYIRDWPAEDDTKA